MASYTLELGFDQNSTGSLILTLFNTTGSSQALASLASSMNQGDTLKFLLCDYTNYASPYPAGAAKPTAIVGPTASFVQLIITNVLPTADVPMFDQQPEVYSLTLLNNEPKTSLVFTGLTAYLLLNSNPTSMDATAFQLTSNPVFTVPIRFRLQFTIGLWNDQTVVHDPEIIVGPGSG